MKKRMRLYNSFRILLMLLICFFSLSAWSQQNKLKNDYVLIINAYSEVAPWSNSIITPVMHYISSVDKTNAEVEHMNMLLLENDSMAEEFSKNLFSKYTAHPPKLLILIGNGTLIFREEFKKHWAKTSIILCGEENFIGPNKYYIGSKYETIPLNERVPLNRLSKEYNLTLLKMSAYPSETVELMNQMIPGMEKFMFVADQGYSNQEYGEQILTTLRKKFPKVTYQRITPEQFSQSALLDTLRYADSKTGILYSSWSYITQSISGGYISVGNAYRLLASLPIPVFSLRYAGMEDGGMVGGYMYNEKHFTEKLINSIKETLSGRQALDIPFYYPNDGAPTFNYAAMVMKGLSPDNCPPDSFFYNKPLTFWGSYKWIILSVVFLLLVLILIQQIRIKWLRRLKESKQKESELNSKYRELIDNMPILYVKERVIRDNSGNPTDTLCCDVNVSFERVFYQKESAIGKKEVSYILICSPIYFIS